MGPYGSACLKHHMLSVQAGCSTHLNNIGIPNQALCSRIPSWQEEVKGLKDIMIEAYI